MIVFSRLSLLFSCDSGLSLVQVAIARISQAFPSRAGQESIKYESAQFLSGDSVLKHIEVDKNEQIRSLPAIGSRSRNKLEKCGLVSHCRKSEFFENLIYRNIVMSRKCQVSGKTALRGNKVSHANNKSLKTWQVNLHNKRLFDPETKKWVKVRVSSRALRTISKNGISDTLKSMGR